VNTPLVALVKPAAPPATEEATAGALDAKDGAAALAPARP